MGISVGEVKEKPIISVIIPYYNVEEYLKECVDSVLKALASIPHEVILVDDRSTDGSTAVAMAFAEENETVFHYSNEVVSRGPSVARNIGLSKATGEYVTFVDADDIVLKTIYQNMLASIQYHHSDVCICDMSRLKGKKQSQSILSTNALMNCTENPTTLERSPYLLYSSSGCDKLVRRGLISEYGIAFPENCLYEDVSFSLQVLIHASSISFIRNVEYLWRVRDNSAHTLSTTQNRQDEDNFNDRIRICAENLRIIKENCSDETVFVLEEKILRFDFEPYLTVIHKQDKENQKRVLAALSAFVNEHIAPESMNRIPVIDREKWDAINRGDIDRLVPILFYKKKNYKNIPLRWVENEPCLEMNPHMFEHALRSAVNEFAFSLPKISVADAQIENNCIKLYGWIYLHRLAVKEKEEQKTQVILYNDIRGEEIPLDTNFWATEEVTELDGAVFNYDTYTETEYNYDGSGFWFEIRAEELFETCDDGDYLLLCNYKNRIRSGKRIIRGIRKEASDVLKEAKIEIPGRKMEFKIDGRKTIHIRISTVEIESERSKKSIRGVLSKIIRT